MSSEISKLLARSFFMGFSLVIMALLARLRVLVQQVSTSSSLFHLMKFQSSVPYIMNMKRDISMP